MVSRRSLLHLACTLHIACCLGCVAESGDDPLSETLAGPLAPPAFDLPGDDPVIMPEEWSAWEQDAEATRGATFYLDPSVGSLDNPGTAEAPLPGLAEVIAADLIQRWVAVDHPHPPTGDVPLHLINPTAPIAPGDRLLLRSGDHGSCTFSDSHNSQFIKVMAEPGQTPVLTYLELVGVENYLVDGLTIRRERDSSQDNSEAKHLIYLHSHNWQGPTRRVIIRNCNVESTESIAGWTASDWVERAADGIVIECSEVGVHDNHIRHVDRGIFVRGDYASITGNWIDGFSGDGMSSLGDDHLFAHNIVRDSYTVDDNHDDGLQVYPFTDDTMVYRVTIRGNIFNSCTEPGRPLQGPMHGIGCFKGGYVDLVIENNLIVTDEWNGIAIYGGYGCRVVNNTLVDADPQLVIGPPVIVVRDHFDGSATQGCLVRNNIAHEIVVDEGVTADHNLFAFDPDQIFEDVAGLDFHLREGSPAVDAGSSSEAPSEDLEGVSRPRGDGVDLGAYER